MISKQLRLIILFVAAALLIGAVYGGVMWYKKAHSDADANESNVELIDGETLTSGGKIRIIPEIASEDISRISIENSNGKYAFKYDKEKNLTTLEGYEDFPIYSSMTDVLFSRVGNIVAITRIDKAPSDLAQYGLAAESSPAHVTVELADGQSYGLFIGDLAPDGSGYYAKSADRDAVYTVTTAVSASLLAASTSYIDPAVSFTISDINYIYIDYLRVKRGDNKIVEFTEVADDYKESTGYIYSHQMIYPTEYSISVTVLEEALRSLANLSGNQVVGFGYVKEDRFDELEEYGFGTALVIEYAYDGVESAFYVGNKTEDNTGYYVYSAIFDTLVIMDAESLPFTEWELIDYMNEYIFQMKIDGIDEISISAFDGFSAAFTLVGSGTDLTVTNNGTKMTDIASFRNLYKLILRLTCGGYCEKPEVEKEILTLKITTSYGNTIEFAFYESTTLRSYYTVNGVGEFYVSRESLTTLIEATKTFAAGGAITVG